MAELIGFLVLSALLGLIAATWPARRAAKLDVLAAIAPSDHCARARARIPNPDEGEALGRRDRRHARCRGAAWLAGHQPPGRPTEPGPVLELLVGVSLLGCGLASWRARPENRIGVVMVLTGFAWFAAQVIEASQPWLYTIGLLVQSLWVIGLLYLLLSFPSGRLTGRTRPLARMGRRRRGVGSAAPGDVLRQPVRRWVAPAVCTTCCRSVHDNHKAKRWLGLRDLFGIALVLTLIAILTRRWWRASARAAPSGCAGAGGGRAPRL